MTSQEAPQPLEISSKQKEAFRATVANLMQTPRVVMDDRVPGKHLPLLTTEYEKDPYYFFLDMPTPGSRPNPKNVELNSVVVETEQKLDDLEDGDILYGVETYELNMVTGRMQYSRSIQERDSEGNAIFSPSEEELSARRGKITQENNLTYSVHDSEITQDRYDKIMKLLGSLTPDDEITDVD